MLRLRTLGSFGVTDSTGVATSLPPHRFALLALVAAAGDRGIARDSLLAYLWPESTPAKARAALEQMLHALRVSLGDRSALLGNPIRLDPSVVSSDVNEFRQALAGSDLESAVALYEGPFLDGFYLSGVPEFEQWLTNERSRLDAEYAAALETLTTQAAARGDRVRTNALIRSLGSVTIPSAAAARRFMEALAASGDRDSAIEFAARFSDRVRSELGVEPDPSVQALADQFRLRSLSLDSHVKPHVSAPPVEPAKGPAAERVSSGSWTRLRYTVLLGAVLSVLAAFGGWAWLRDSSSGYLDPNVIAVMPFRVTAHDSSYNYLREGTIDYLNARLTGGGLPRGLDSRTLLVAWRRAAEDRAELTEQQSASLARQLGAGQILSGSFIITPNRSVITASLRDVSSGRELLTYRDDVVAEELRLIDGLTRALLARTAQTNGLASPVLSESLESVKEYLTGVRAARENRWVLAGQHYTRALNIDSTFAHAALKQWEAVLEGSAFPTPIGPPYIDGYFNRAWALRERLSAREQLYLKGLGTYYLHRDEASATAALEAAAHAAPDDAKVWTSWGRRLIIFGPLSGTPDWLRRAATVLDSAIALDSSNAASVRYRLFVALHGRRASDIRTYLRLIEQLAPNGDDTDALRWAAGQLLNDDVALQAIRARLATLSAQSVHTMGHIALIEGLPLGDVQDALEKRRALSIKEALVSIADAEWLFQVLAARGRVGAALAIADSVMRVPDRKLPFAQFVIRQALLEPALGYDGAAKSLVRSLRKEIAERFRTWYPSRDRSLFCLTHAFQVVEGDTSQTRAAIGRVQSIADKSPLAALRDTRGGSCPDLLQALVDPKRSPQAISPALDRLDSLLAGGVFWDVVSTTATVLLARAQESRQMYAAGLATVQRQNRGERDYQVAVWPSVLRIEGRLSATVGDTAGAVRAYTHYLRLRDQPDSGAMASEVAEVRAHLAQLRRGATR